MHELCERRPKIWLGTRRSVALLVLESRGNGKKQVCYQGGAVPNTHVSPAGVELSETIEYLLLDLMYAPKGSALATLAEFLVRLEDLSHCLVWTGECFADDVHHLTSFQPT